MTKVIEECRLACTDLKNGHQKLYWMDLNDDGTVRVRYGRVKETSTGELIFQTDKIEQGGRSYFEKQKRDKMRAGRSSGTYKEQPIVKSVESSSFVASPANQTIEQIALEQIKTNSPEVKNLIKFLAQANIHNIVSNTKIQYNSTTGLFSTSFGLITKAGIDEARQHLSSIKRAMESKQFGSEFETAIDGYLAIIPRNLARQKASYHSVFPDVKEILKQNEILDSLESSLVELTKPKVTSGEIQEIEKIFNCSLELVTDTQEFEIVNKAYLSTAKDMHAFATGFKVSKVYRVDLVAMREAYEKDGKILGEEKKLWHGTAGANILSILRSGFQITPPATAHIAGKAFGNGIYNAIHSTKAMGYATSFWGGSGGGRNKAFMFLNDVALGKFYVPRQSTSEPPPTGYHTYWAKPTETRKFGGYLENDEIIVFSPSQMNPVYLVELEQ